MPSMHPVEIIGRLRRIHQVTLVPGETECLVGSEDVRCPLRSEGGVGDVDQPFQLGFLPSMVPESIGWGSVSL